MKFRESSHVLIVTGAITDSLALVAKKRRFSSKELMLQSDELLATISSYPTGEDIIDVQWRTLIANRTVEIAVPPASYRESYFACRQWSQQARLNQTKPGQVKPNQAKSIIQAN
jgi:hypothetical protein